MATSSIVTIVLGLALLFWSLGAYNRLTRLKNRVVSGFASMAQQLQMREEVAIRLGGVCASHAGVDARLQETLVAAAVQARVAREAVLSQTHNEEAVHALAAAQRVMAMSVQRLMAVAETSATLYVDQNFHQLCDELAAAEGVVSLARQSYNRAVLQYNQGVQQFPALVLAKLFGFTLGAELPSTEPTLVRRTAPVPMQ
jgi:LemA protein